MDWSAFIACQVCVERLTSARRSSRRGAIDTLPEATEAAEAAETPEAAGQQDPPPPDDPATAPGDQGEDRAREGAETARDGAGLRTNPLSATDLCPRPRFRGLPRGGAVPLCRRGGLRIPALSGPLLPPDPDRDGHCRTRTRTLPAVAFLRFDGPHACGAVRAPSGNRVTEGSKRVETRRSSASLRTMTSTRRKNMARSHRCSGVADHRPAAAELAGTLATRAPAAPTAAKATECVSKSYASSRLHVITIKAGRQARRASNAALGLSQSLALGRRRRRPTRGSDP